MYKVLYIDEDASDRRDFKTYCKGHFEVNDLHPPVTLGELLEIIDEVAPDAVITDYHLTEKDENVTYNGDDVAVKFLGIREKFPVFVFTSYEDDAILEEIDPMLVFTKDIMEDDEIDAVIKFKQRVSRKIEIYQDHIMKIEESLISLNQKKTKSDEDIVNIIKLDNELERSLGKNTSISPELKKRAYSDDLAEMLEKAEEIIKNISK